jgi:hypothetical protein
MVIYIHTWCNTQEIFGGQSNIYPTFLVPSPSDGVQTPQTKFIKTCLSEIVNLSSPPKQLHYLVLWFIATIFPPLTYCKL